MITKLEKETIFFDIGVMGPMSFWIHPWFNLEI
jgi:hypothetical protein